MTSALIILEHMAIIVSCELLLLFMRFQKYAIWVSRAATLDFSHPGKLAKMIVIQILMYFMEQDMYLNLIIYNPAFFCCYFRLNVLSSDVTNARLLNYK